MSRLRVAGLHGLVGPFDLVADRETLAISGPSGSGKSLLLRMIADLDPHEGEAWLGDASRREMSAPAWRRQVVYNAAETGWWELGVAAHFSAAGLAFARDLAPQLGLVPALFDGPVQRLSSGERQRIALLRALAGDPPVLLLDEPTGALDLDTTRQVEAVLQRRQRAGRTTIVVTHDPGQPERLGARHLRLHEHQLIPA